MRKKKNVLIVLLVLIVAVTGITWLCNKTITNAAKGKLYTDAKAVPYNKVGLLLGTAKTGANGYQNMYYEYRIRAAVQLVKEQKIKYLVISGDNGRKDYNEPEAMRSDLIAAGVDSTIIYLDYAGFRTYDSMVRLKEIFGQEAVTVISQKFHNERAIYIAAKKGIATIGYNATDVSARAGIKTQWREKLARVKVFTDFLFGAKPKYLGSKIVIPA